MLRVLTLATLFPNAPQADPGRVRRAADAGAGRARRASRCGSWRRSGCRSGRCRSTRIMRRCAACRSVRAGTGSTSIGRATGSGRGSAIGGTARRMADALLPVLRQIRAGFPVRRDRRRILLAGRPGRGAARRGAGRALLDQGAGQRHPFLGRRPGIGPRRWSRRRGRRTGCSRSRAALKRRHGRARHAGGEDPGPLYRHRSRRRSGRSTGRRRKPRSASTGRCSSPPAACCSARARTSPSRR